MTETTSLTIPLNPNNPDTEKTGLKENTIKDNMNIIEGPTKMTCLIQSKDGTGVPEMSSMDQLECLVKNKVNNSSMNMKKKKAAILRDAKNSWKEKESATLCSL